MNSYYYIDDNSKQQSGPVPANDLKGRINGETMVWCAGMTDWAAAKTVAELQPLFSTTTAQPTQQAAPSAANYQQPPYNSQQQRQPMQPMQGNMQRPNGQFNQFSGGFMNNIDIRPMPKNWLVESVLMTVLCCPPFGIVSIVYATKVESRYFAGDYDGAVDAAKNAKTWLIVALSLWGVLIVFYAIMAMIGVASAL